ncbi:MAG: FAD-dependent monooxygenase [Alphaproteobacteria bacterium]|nr:FAD-dependent monooxygenase [Alphaproteobacteria bacterium]
MNKKHADIIIAGGGLNGLIAGMVAAKAGYNTLMVEPQSAVALNTVQSPQLDATVNDALAKDATVNDGRASTIAATSFALLKRMGLADDLAPHAQRINDIRVTEADPLWGVSPFFLHFSAEKLAKKKPTNDEPFGYVIENTILRQCFYAHANKCDNLQILHGASVAQVDFTPKTDDANNDNSGSNQQQAPQQIIGVTLDNGAHYSANLIIACDGRNSKIRGQAGIDAMQWHYKQKAIITAVHHERKHGGVAVEQFHPSGAFAILPLCGEDRCEQKSAIVWIERGETADRLNQLDDAHFLLLLKEKFGDFLGDVALAAPRQCYPLSFSHAKKYYQHRLLLLGDSAHAIHPLAGQGLNLGLRDSAVLWDMLEKCRRLGLDIGRTENLHDFERGRKADNHAVAAMTDLLNRLFANRIPPLRLLRQLGMHAVNKNPAMKNFFAYRAMGVKKNMSDKMKLN